MTEAPHSFAQIIASFFARVWAFIKRHKKLFIVLAVVAALAVAGLLLLRGMGNAATATVQPPQTLTLERVDLQQIVSGTGTLQTAAPREVTTSLSHEVAEIYVKEGDLVQAGQVLAQLDTAQLEQDIEDARTSVSEAQAKDALSLSQARRKLQDAIDTRSLNRSKNDQSVQTALEAIEAARAEAGNTALDAAAANAAQAAARIAENDMNAAKTALSNAQGAYDAANVALQGLAGQLAQCDAAPDKEAAAQALGHASYADLAAKHAAAQSTLAGEQPKLSAAEAAAEAAQRTYNTAYQTAYGQFKAANPHIYDNAYQNADVAAQTTTYNTAVETRDAAWRSDSISVENAQDSVDSQVLQDSAATARTQLEGYLEDLEDCSIQAPVAGTVTAMNVKVGQSAGAGSLASGAAAATSTALFTIEDVRSLEITSSVPEYDAVDLRPGMRVSITTDALTGQEWTGTLSTISAKATDDNGSFTVTVGVVSPVGELAIGMSAKINIITNATNDVFAVPYDAVTTDSTGAAVVYAYAEGAPSTAVGSNSEGSTPPAGAMGRPIPVQTGMETDYYIEIQGEGLEAGMVLLADPEGKNVSTGTGMAGFPMGGGF